MRAATYLNQISQDYISMWLQYRESHKEDEFVAVIIGPQDFPQSQDVFKRKLPLECNKYPTEEFG